MKKVIYLKESELRYIVESVVNETLEKQINEGRLARAAGTALLAASSLLPGKAKAQTTASQDSTQNKTEYVASDSTQQDKNSSMTRPQQRQANRQARRDERQANRAGKKAAKEWYNKRKSEVDSTYNANMERLKANQKTSEKKAKEEQRALDAKSNENARKVADADNKLQKSSERISKLKSIEDEHMKKYGDNHIHSPRDYRKTKRQLRRAMR